MGGAAGGQEEAGVGIGRGQTLGQACGAFDVGLERAGARTLFGESAQRVHVQSQLGARGGLGDGVQPLAGLGRQPAGVERHRRQVDLHAFERAGQVGGGAHRHAVLAGRIDPQQQRIAAVLQVLQRVSLSLGGIGVVDDGAHVPAAGALAACDVEAGGLGQRRRRAIGGVQRPGFQPAGAAHGQPLQRLAFQRLLHQPEPGLGGGLGEIGGEGGRFTHGRACSA